MARYTKADTTETFRVKISESGVRTDGTDWGFTRYRGPYGTLAAARGIRTHELNTRSRWRPKDTLEVVIERSTVAWEIVE